MKSGGDPHRHDDFIKRNFGKLNDGDMAYERNTTISMIRHRRVALGLRYDHKLWKKMQRKGIDRSYGLN